MESVPNVVEQQVVKPKPNYVIYIYIHIRRNKLRARMVRVCRIGSFLM